MFLGGHPCVHGCPFCVFGANSSTTAVRRDDSVDFITFFMHRSCSVVRKHPTLPNDAKRDPRFRLGRIVGSGCLNPLPRSLAVVPAVTLLEIQNRPLHS